MAALAVTDDELIHDPAARADELVFGLLAQQGELGRVDRPRAVEREVDEPIPEGDSSEADELNPAPSGTFPSIMTFAPRSLTPDRVSIVATPIA